MVIRKVTYALFLSFIYYMTVRLFVLYGAMSEFTLLGESRHAIFAFYLTYFAFISIYYVDSINSMYLIRYKSCKNAIRWMMKKLFYHNVIFTTIFTLVMLYILYLNHREISLFYTLKFYILIHVCLLILNLFIVVIHLLFNERIAIICAIILFLIASFFVSVDGTAHPYTPVYLYLAPLNSWGEIVRLVVFTSLYFFSLIAFFYMTWKVKRR